MFLQRNLLKLVSFLLLSFLFFFRLDYTALESYDEAWFADITRNLVVSKNPLELSFNQARFTDHPPLIFMLMAVPSVLSPNQEFAARFISAALGSLTDWLVYEIGKKLNRPLVGLGASMILLSSMWFMIRARSGNLDIPLLFFIAFTYFELILYDQKKNAKEFYLATMGLAFSVLSKTLVGFGLLPVYAYFIWLNREEISLQKNALKISLLFLSIVSPWYVYNQLIDPSFLGHHFFDIAGRGRENYFSWQFIQRSLFYLQVGMGKWLKVFLFSIPVSLLFYRNSKKDRKKIISLGLLFLGFAAPLLFSSKVEIWHLIPLYLPISLGIAYFFLGSVKIFFPKRKYLKLIGFLGIVVIAVYQFYSFSNLIYLRTPKISYERDISRKASGYSQIYLMTSFYPAAVFYSESRVIPLRLRGDAYQEMTALLNGENIFLIDLPLLSDLKRDGLNFQVVENNLEYYLVR